MHTLALLASLHILLVPIGRSQSKENQQRADVVLPKFEVASVRLASPQEDEINTFLVYPGGRILARGCTLQYLTMLAFSVGDFQIDGGPHWIKDARFDIQAETNTAPLSREDGSPTAKLPPNSKERLMLQSLLVDRFGFRSHRETREGTVYLLTANAKRLKLQPAENMKAFPWAGGIEGGLPDGSGIRGTNISMSQLAERLSQWLGRPVLDQTQLKGPFDFRYQFDTSGVISNSEIVSSSIITSLRAIGLDLKATKGSFEVLKIDQAQMPTEN